MKSKAVKTFISKKRSIYNPPKIKGPWTLNEDLLLKQWVETYGPSNWGLCAKNIPGRNQRQCRQHWFNKLKPNLIVGNWTSEEIFLIIVFYKKLNGSWKKMIPLFRSRTENSIKNIFYSQTRAIISKIKKKKNKNYELSTLLKYYDIVYDVCKKKFLEDNPMSEIELQNFIKFAENKLEKNPNNENEDKNIENKNKKIKSAEFKNFEETKNGPKTEKQKNQKINKNKENNNTDNTFINNNLINDINDINDIQNNFNFFFGNNIYFYNSIKLLLALNNIISYNIILYFFTENLYNNILNSGTTNINYNNIYNNNINCDCPLDGDNQINNIIDNINFMPTNENNLINSLSKNQIEILKYFLNNGNASANNKEEKSEEDNKN